jgi:uncharacterized damage-inducible protein DinB
MTTIDLILLLTRQAHEGLFHQARKVPADKLEWQPLETGRSVLDIAAECALSPTWGSEVVEMGGFQMTEEVMAEFNAAKAALTTLDECEKLANENLAKFEAFTRELPAERLDEIIEMPFGRTKEWPVADVLLLHQWNCVYHVGQICYIQTLYGDNSME